MAYGVATNNIFDLLDEENEDPQALASKAAVDAEQPKAVKEAAPKAKEVPKTAGVFAWAQHTCARASGHQAIPT